MRVPPQISFRNMDPSPALEAKVRERIKDLERVCDDVMSCRVVVELRHRHHHQGNLYHARVDLRVPGEEIVVSRDPTDDHAHEDAYVVVRNAFDAVRRRLEDYARKRRGEVKKHATGG